MRLKNGCLKAIAVSLLPPRLLSAGMIAVGLSATQALGFPSPTMHFTTPNGGCGGPVIDFYTGLTSDEGGTAKLNLSDHLHPVISASGTQFNLFFGFADHNCGPHGAAVNSFSIVGGPVLPHQFDDGKFSILDTVTSPFGTDVTANFAVTSNGSPIAIRIDDFTQHDFSFSGLPVLTGFDLDFSLPEDPPINVTFDIVPAGGGPIPFSTAPEPATLALFGAGLAGLGALRRRRKVKA